MAEIPKLDLHSKDIAADKQQKLKELFPEIFTEGDKIDFDKLRLILGESIDTNDERFGLHWAGKNDCFNIIQEPSIGTLKPAKDESVNWDDTENLFIEGDNLEVLKLLQKSYYGKVKMIYIDPPYNTGKEFIYPDRYQENIETYLAYTGQVDDDGYKFSTNAETEGRFHSNWLNMMYPRLFLSRNLLREDGVIFISIDDHEVDNLIKLCSEIFGEENFIANLAVQINPRGRNLDKFIAKTHESVLVFGKNSLELSTMYGLEKEGRMVNDYNKNDDRGAFRLIGLRNRNQAFNPTTRPKLFYPLYVRESDGAISLESNDEYTQEVYPTTAEGVKTCWTWGKDKVKNENHLLTAEISADRWRIFRKDYLHDEDGNSARTLPKSLWIDKEINNDYGKKSIKNLFGSNVMDFPKSPFLIGKMIKASTASDDIVLDFFAGSCPTAHSIYNINISEGGNRKYIMVQLPEPTEENTEANKQGLKTIAEIGKERIRRTAKKIEEKRKALENDLKIKEVELTKLEEEKAKTPKLFENGKSKELTKLESNIEKIQTELANIESTDLGFRVFKLDKSNFKIWDGSVENDVPKQIELAINHINPDSSEFDILFEILIKAGFELTLPIQELNLADKKVYSVEDNALLICLEKELTEDVIRAIADKAPARVVCLDSGFKDNDQLKTNAVQIMKSHNVHDFKTV